MVEETHAPPKEQHPTIRSIVNTNIGSRVLHGGVQTEGRDSPLVEGKVQTIPKNTQVSLTLPQGLNLNSEMTQMGDEVWMRVSNDVPGANGVAVPGGWYAHGVVTEAKGQRRGNRDGYIEIEFQEIVSPDGMTHVQFPAKISTKDSMMKSTLKQVATGTTYATIGATGGALISLQLTGIGGAIATHGISVGAGAAIGASLGLIGAVKKKGKVASLYSDDDVKLTIAEPITLPAFRAEKLPSAKPVPKLKNMKISVHNFKFYKDPYGDPGSRILDVDITIANHTSKAFSAGQLRVLDDHGREFTPFVGENIKQVMHKVEPDQEERINVMYEVNSQKRKYWLSLRENGTGAELSRVPVNVD